ncbi:MAG: glutathione S-transferase N-terminal domain-containing protein [Actinomycetota bacterium]|nr:glutathione S-transferase N-terminal domain-containing protein [Actinomycetota bacterium]
MPATLYVVHGSHPCATVARALDFKAVAYKTVELPVGAHAGVMRVLFGRRTVPGIRLESGEKLSGSRAILRRLDELVPEPPLLPADPAARARTLETERWGDEVLQAATRRIFWPTLLANPSAAPSFSEGAKLPLPAPVLKAAVPVIGRLALRLTASSEATRAADLQALPGWLQQIDDRLADGTLGADPPNAADLQIAPSLKLLMAMEDLRAIIAPRPCGAWADQLFPDGVGHFPAGAIPASILPVGV